MIAVDTNILVYAHREDSLWHEIALVRMTELANSGKPWAIPWSSVHEFLAIVTHPKIYKPPTPLATAIGAIDAWQGSSGLRLIGEGSGYFETLSKQAIRGKIKGPRIHDTRIASVCLHHGVKRLWTADRDFSSFPDLRCENPLV
ncbi:MAG: type II toxin-antitoxin system VapC family toxin [Akkermansiaceae bacterium]